ncbi:MBL fold metallo-hydrolase [Noviherbaspirillum agri]
MKFASLGSGSEGNALLISSCSGLSRTTVMLDCGFAVRETERRLQRFGMAPTDIDAIVVTHEHQDHVGGVFKFARRYKIPVWLSYGTFRAVEKHCDGVLFHFCRDGEAVGIRDLELTPYTVPHDAREPVQYVVHDGEFRLGVLTDAGHSTQHMINALGGCDALMLECNHDRQMLASSNYPPTLKQRIGGPYGHLANDSTAQILAALDRSRLKTVVGAHLSQQNNTPELAREALCAVADPLDFRIMIACQDEGFDWVNVRV